MPTAGRLAGALCFALLGALLAYLTIPLFKEARVPSFWWPLTIGSGLWAGWVVVGSRVGRGISSAIGNGLTGVAAQVFWILFVLASVEMVQKSLRKSYDSALEAIVNVFELGIGHAVVFGANMDVLTAIVAGGIVCGLIAEFFGRRLP